MRSIASQIRSWLSGIASLRRLSALQAKIASLPEVRWRNKPSYILFTVGGFSPELHKLAADPTERLHLVQGADLLSD